MQLFDAFISHAGEDKDAFVRPLAHRLEEEHISVWFDEFELKVGDSLSASIDRGLAQSRFGIVVLSPSFFAKRWPQRELKGLVAREMIGGERVILPIWLNITKEEICEHSPPLTDTVALRADFGLDEVVRQLKKVIRPQGSPLIAARDRLIDFGISPPVVTDEWWLDVVEASNRETGWGFAPQRPSWGRWTFPLPGEGDTADERGERLAWTAMQMRWEEEADKRRICQITRPEEVLHFIESLPGLAETAARYPVFLATYAPQLTIPGLGGIFETVFDELLARSMKDNERYRGTSVGSALTTTAEPPPCEEFIALRHPAFGDYRPGSIACQFVQGDIGGPPCKLYPTIEYLVWLLSEKSAWLQERARTFLLEGMRRWTVWLWLDTPTSEEQEFGLAPYKGFGALFHAVLAAEKSDNLRLTKAARADIVNRVGFSRELLQLPEPTAALVDRFLAGGFMEAYVQKRRERVEREKAKTRSTRASRRPR